MNGETTSLSIDQLQPNPLQPRGAISPQSLTDLIDSIKVHGIIEPLVIAHTPAGYQIIAGERRWRAAKLADLKEVPVIIKETTPQGMLEMAIVENVQRQDLNPVERAKSFERLINEFKMSNQEVAKRISKSPAYVSNTLKLLKLPDALTDGLISGVITEGHARALSAIKDTQTMIEAYKTILKEDGSVRRAEELARRLKRSQKTQQRSKKPKKDSPVNEEIDVMAQDLQKVIGDGSSVKIRRSKVETAIHIALKGNVKQTQETLENIYRWVTGTKI